MSPSPSNEPPGIVGPTPKQTPIDLRATTLSASGWNANDTHEVVRPLGEAFSEGEIHLTKSMRNNRLFVLKHHSARKVPPKFKDHFTNDHEGFRVPNEVRMLKSHIGVHPNLVFVFDIFRDGREPGRWQVWQEFCEGGDLFAQMCHWIDTKKELVPEDFVLHVYASVADGLAFLHHGLRHVGDGKYTQDPGHKAIIHGDLKPDNIFLRWTSNSNVGGMPKIVIGDFGTSKLASERVNIDPGTVKYWSPESLAKLGGDVNLRYTWKSCQTFYDAVNSHTTAFDIYSFGQIMLLMASRRKDVAPIGSEPKTLQVRPQYKFMGLRAVIVRCLAIDPAKRSEMSFREGLGLLPAVELVRKARDKIIEEMGELEREEWLHPRGE